MKLMGVQFNVAWEDKAANHQQVLALLESAEIPAGSLVALPEMFSTGFSMNVATIAEGDSRETERFLAELARKRGIFVMGGLVSAAGDGRGRNEAAIFGPDGSPILRYQKIHPFRFAGETDYYEPGSVIKTFSWNGFTVAPFVCYDLRFPEVFRQAVRQGAEMFCVIANWPTPRVEHWMTLLRARAIENQAYVLGVNRCGADPKVGYPGCSVLVDPRGEVLVDAGNGEQVFGAVPDRELLLEYRARFPALQDMRTEYLGPASLSQG